MILTSNSKFWHQKLEVPLMERVELNTPAEILSHVALVNSFEQKTDNPEALFISEDFFKDAQKAIEEIPLIIQEKLNDKLLGIYFGTGWGSSALTDVVADEKGNVIGSVVAVDVKTLLNHSANSWSAWKENTPFTEGPYKIDATIETASNDHRKNAIQYLLLHEFGHVLTAQKDFLPDWWLKAEHFKSTDEYSFLPISWQINIANQIIPLIKEDFQYRDKVNYYSGEQLPNHEIADIYEALDKTSFVSLYAATSAYEDFAEMFAYYVHVVLMEKPYEISLWHKDDLILSFNHFKNHHRFKQKHQFFTSFFK